MPRKRIRKPAGGFQPVSAITVLALAAVAALALLCGPAGAQVMNGTVPAGASNENGGSTASTSPITVLNASGAPSLREWLVMVHCTRSDAGTSAITVAISDGTKTRTYAVPNTGGGGGFFAPFPAPIPFAANTAVTATPSAAVSTLYCDAQGYNAP